MALVARGSKMSSVPPVSTFIARLALSYVAGTILAPLLWVLPVATTYSIKWKILSIFTGLAALSVMFSFKYFLIALVLALLFHRSISNHLLIWCAASLPAVPVLWLAEVYLREARGKDILPFLKNTGEVAMVVCYYVFVYAAIFYAWNRVARTRAQQEADLKT
jgi:hypothetical protein